MKKTYVMVGAGGYVAPKHMKAIHDTGGQLIATYDPSDSMGILDSYFPQCMAFNQWHKFHKAIRHAPIDYFVICSPNDHHFFHIQYGLSVAQNVICEKPLVLSAAELDELETYSQQFPKKKIYPVLQLRDIHPDKSLYGNNLVKVDYNTPRGHWYTQSWKFNPAHSGGLLMNIGIHLFDFLIHKFGEVKKAELDFYSGYHAKGFLYLDRAAVNWNISIDPNKEPKRQFVINDELLDLSPKFHDHHTRVYMNILEGYGNDFRSTRSAIELVNRLNQMAGHRLWESFDKMNNLF